MNCFPLLQIGPRMTLQLVKIVEGLGEGKVMYHSIGTVLSHLKGNCLGVIHCARVRQV